MNKLKWKKNHYREAMRGRDEPSFEWWTAHWFVIYLHVHNKDGHWTYIIRGAEERKSLKTFTTKEGAMAAVEKRIEIERIP